MLVLLFAKEYSITKASVFTEILSKKSLKIFVINQSDYADLNRTVIPHVLWSGEFLLNINVLQNVDLESESKLRNVSNLIVL